MMIVLNPPLSLAASPSIDYENTEVERYFIISSSETPIDFPCSIEPGGLVEKYEVKWTQDPWKQLLRQTFSISPVVTPESPIMFQCHVTIEHTNGIHNIYNGPEVTVNTKGQ